MKRFILALVAILTAFPAYALTIRNLSESVQVVIVERGGQQQEATINPGHSIHIYGADIALAMPGKPFRQAEHYEEYAIWPDGNLIIQKHQITKGRGGGL